MQIIGHRGARGEAPENTLGGFQYLRDLGVYAVEFDIRQLADDALIVMHDDNFLRTSGIDQTVQACTTQDLLRFNQTQGWASWSTIEHPPLLAEVLSLIHDFQHIEIEIKPVDNDEQAQTLVQALEQLLQQQKLLEQITLTSFDLKILKALQDNQSRFKRGLLVEIPIGEHAIALAQQYGCTRIGWKDILANADIIKQSQQAGFELSVWTVNDIERIKALCDMGVRDIITDYPKRILSLL